ncbi:hypothetical protein ACQ0P8_06520 [Halodesulfovibrio aestuarii]|uniref:Pentapeptide repeat-containing protein n=1 Tax=Halodesulfovibrio aestuarii TaxID=126333 RepID=A0A8G2CCD2_9BACT|nr:hypothetical protein [Halodesulfovibrio aestuarii]SHJ76278.1 hypothetical protein SAMN05660830_03167 [Halodesulfovibrio aestuarii]
MRKGQNSTYFQKFTDIAAQDVLDSVFYFLSTSYNPDEKYYVFTDNIYTFNLANVVGELSFQNYADLREHVPAIHFQQCHFSGDIHLTECACDRIIFSNCTIEGHLFCEAGIFNRLTLNDSTINGNASFYDSVFEGPLVFRRTKLNAATFVRSSFNHQVMFRLCEVERNFEVKDTVLENNMLILEDMPLEKFDIGTAEINKLILSNCRWPSCEKISSSNIVTERIARDWKNKAISLSDTGAVSLWHQCEKEFTLKRARETKNWFMMFLLFCYRQLSMYGESPARAAIWLFLFLTIPFLLSFTGAYSSHYAWAGIPFFSKAAPSILHKSTGLKLFWLFTQGAITLQLSLLFFAIRNKLRR